MATVRAALSEPAPAAPRPLRGAPRLEAGVVAVPVADLRRRPDHASELVNQVLFGETVRVRRIGADRRWLRVASEEDGYEGWMRSWSLALGPALAVTRWRGRARHLVDRPWLERTDLPGGALPFCARLAKSPDGDALGPLGPIGLRHGWRGTERLPAPRRGGAPRGERLLATAQRFLGVPYHWGGRSFAGVDCSGLVQLAARRQGLTLPRDAQQQCVALGGVSRLRRLEEAVPGGRRAGLGAGDLWFFGPSSKTVTHVAISAGGLGLLHAYGAVRRGSLDPQSPAFEPELLRNVLGWQTIANN